MDLPLPTEDHFGSWILLVVLLILVIKLGDIIWVIAVSIIAKVLSKHGYDVMIDKFGVSLARNGSSYRRNNKLAKSSQKSKEKFKAIFRLRRDSSRKRRWLTSYKL